MNDPSPAPPRPTLDALVKALRLSDRCPAYCPEDGSDSCDGFPWCEDCLTLAAQAIRDYCE